MKKSILPLFPIAVLLLLLSHPALSLQGARDGLLLWFDVVLPTLLPFMLCSSLIVAWGGVEFLTSPFGPVFKMLGLTSQGSYALMAGLLCGYPMGAKTTADFMRQGELSASEGKQLLAIAAWPSPMFLAGYTRSFLGPDIPFSRLLAAVYLPLLIMAFLSRLVYPPGKRALQSRPFTPPGKQEILLPEEQGSRRTPASLQEEDGPLPQPFDAILMNCLEVMVKIGGYIMLFSILALFVKKLFPDSPLKPLILGSVEMTTGIRAIASSLKGIPAAAAMAAAAAFGGFCGVFQTSAVIKNAGLSIRHYILWKLLHAGLTSALFILLSYR